LAITSPSSGSICGSWPFEPLAIPHPLAREWEAEDDMSTDMVLFF
jgi:hypothetical protein